MDACITLSVFAWQVPPCHPLIEQQQDVCGPLPILLIATPPSTLRGAMPSELGVHLLTTLPLAYICVCTYFALFRLNAFDYNKLLPR